MDDSNEMNTLELARLIVEETEIYSQTFPDVFSPLDVGYILETIDIDGKDNNHLANPLNKDPECYYFRPRETSLSGKEIVVGNYLLFDYCAHDESMYLTQYASLKELEQGILNERGITNTFTTHVIAIVRGQVKRYQILYQRDSFSGKVIFKKEQQVRESLFEKLTDVELEWLD